MKNKQCIKKIKIIKKGSSTSLVSILEGRLVWGGNLMCVKQHMGLFWRESDQSPQLLYSEILYYIFLKGIRYQFKRIQNPI